MSIKEFYREKTVLVTGALGFLGSNLIQSLVSLGAKVTAVDNLDQRYGGNKFNINNCEDEISIIFADIRNEEEMRDAVKGKDVIFNMAAQVSYIDSQEDAFNDLDVNCRGHLNILELCRKYNRDAKLIFPGSRMQYGQIVYNPVDESHPLEPLSIYGIHKLTAEKYYLMYCRKHKIRSVVFRIANPYGPRNQMRHHKYGIVNYFVKLAIRNETIRIFGDGLQVRDYIYVSDIIDVFLSAGARDEADGQVFNIGTGIPTKFCDMARMVCEVVDGGKIENVPWPGDYERIETGDYYLNIDKAKEILRWAPRIDLRRGVMETYRYYQEYGDKYW